MDYSFSDNIRDLKPSAIREIFKSLSDPSVISFAAGNPSPESFPKEEMAEISAKIFSDSALVSKALQYGITEGDALLRKLVRERLAEKFSLKNEGDDLIIVTGGQQGLDLSCKVTCNPGDVILCEEPTFIGALNSFRASGVRPVGIPLSSDGIDTNALEEALKREKNVRLIYVIPTFQNPTGLTTSLEKRKKILELASKYNVLILEDNPYGELRFAGEEVPTIKSMDTEGRVIYCGSFSKILSAGMRVGFVLAPAAITQKIVVAKQVNDVHTNVFFQMICAEYMQHYDLDAHIAKTRALYRRKCTHMLSCLDRYVGNLAEYTRPEGGLFIWCNTRDASPSKPIVQACLKEKLAVVPGEAFLCDTEAQSNGFRLNYSMPSDEQIEQGAKILADVLKAR
ncbi:MAG: PLP-dependent aminotransferase family protein [Clostridia bacterium]|nr:PLP-dependent aminotransferase family protein [Clostridia bacterium]